MQNHVVLDSCWKNVVLLMGDGWTDSDPDRERIQSPPVGPGITEVGGGVKL